MLVHRPGSVRRSARTTFVWLVVVLFGAWIGTATIASAASISRPPGWDEGDAAAPLAQRRAEAWAKAWGGKVQQVMSTRADDAFLETLVLIDVDTPLPTEVLAKLEPGRSWLEARAQAALQTTTRFEPDTVELLPLPEPGVSLLRARLELGDRVVLVAVAPTGARHLALILVFATGEDVLYTSVFDNALDELGGLRAPIMPFPRSATRLAALLAWLGLGTLLGIAWVRRSLPRPGARVAGRQVSALLLSTSALVFMVAAVSLGDARVELTLAESSPWGMALELAMGGAIVAMALWIGTELWERRLAPVASAPQQGSFAAVGTAPGRAAASTPSVVATPMTLTPPGPEPNATDARVRPRIHGIAVEDEPASLVDAREPPRDPS